MRRIPLPTHSVRLTYVFLGLIAVVFVAQLALQSLLGFDFIILFGAKENGFIAQGEFWRLLTAVFIHGSVLHFLFNAYALYLLGRQAEAFYGPIRFGLIFLLAGLSGSLASMLLNPAPSVGASGAIFGLIGMEGVFLYRNRQLLGEGGRRALQNVVVIVVLNLLIGLQGGIDNWAHLGGLVSGLALAWFVGPIWAFDPGAAYGGEMRVMDQRPLTGGGWLSFASFAALWLTIFSMALNRYR